MSDGRKFTKTDSTLSPEDRLADVERNYSVILQRIQAYDKVLEDFSVIKSHLSDHAMKLKDLVAALADFKIETKTHSESIAKSASDSKTSQGNINNTLSENVKGLTHLINSLNLSVENLAVEIQRLKNDSKSQESTHSTTQVSVSELENGVRDVKGRLAHLLVRMDSLQQNHDNLKTHSQASHHSLSSEVGKLLSSLNEMPEFNEWATKIYIKVCNEINDKQKQLHSELDKKCQQLKEQLSSDPYTADSVKKILQNEIDNLAMDGRNAYIKATNASQQIQMLEKKVENITLILKKYELNR